METILKLFFPSLEVISDRTTRNTLKLVSKKVHKINLDEVEFFLDRSELRSPLRQSLLDRINPKLEGTTNYYIEVFKKGSLEIQVIISALPLLWLLKNTVGKSISEAYEKSNLHRWLVSFLSNQVVKDSKSLNRKKDQLTKNEAIDGTRWKFLQSQYEFHFSEGSKFGRFEVENMNISQGKDGNMEVSVCFQTQEEFIDEVDREPIYTKTVIETAKLTISANKSTLGKKRKKL
ncbi:MAG: hypothetical protein ACQ9MH_13360 [Nitrospinales bacterium]